MTAGKQQEIGKALWTIANSLRGSMMADDFRDYMLSFLFYKYLSKKYLDAAQKELGKEYPTPQKQDRRIPLQIWYDDNPADITLFENQMRKKIHYVIEPKYLWDNIVEMARTQNREPYMIEILASGFHHIEEKSFASSFRGLFSEVNLMSEKLGKSLSDKNNLLSKVIWAIEYKLSELSAENDELGDAYEYLIGQFAAGSGQKAGEFYTPQAISTILSRIATLDCHTPQSGKKAKITKVLDFACGSGSLLLNVRREMGEKGIGKIYGQEKNITTYNLARMNMLLHGVKDTEFEIHHGDTLANDWDILNEPNPAKKIEFDAIVANPPFSLRWDPSEETAKDFRFSRYGIAPKSAADFAFLLHGLHYLSDDGTMAIILPHGVLFRGGREEPIRKKLLEDDYIDAIIGLPSNLFYSTGIPVCIVVLKKCRKTKDILFINAAEYFTPAKRQNILEEKHVDKIVEAYKYREEIPRFSRKVEPEEIAENGYNLNIVRYVNLAQEEEPIDLNDVHNQLVEIEKEIATAKAEHNKYLRELGLPELP